VEVNQLNCSEVACGGRSLARDSHSPRNNPDLVYNSNFEDLKMMLRVESHMRKMLIFTCVTFAAAGIYLGWIYYSRWRNSQALIQRLKAPVEARDRAFVGAYGGGIRILSFYAVPSTIRRGETAQLCYGVANAESVRIEPPPVEAIWPSLSRCVAVVPQTDTDYRLIAKDGRKNTRTADLRVTVH
jgi:hypothetical protein